jgi:hypothetical protein
MKKWALGTAVWGWAVDKKECFKMLDVFYERGERYIDTASNYPINGLSKDRYASENIIGEWIKVNGINDLNIIYKLGSIVNTNTPENNLSPEFVTKEFNRIITKFDDNKIIPMIHWDNRDNTNEIRNSLAKLISLTWTDIGFSGIKYPEKYNEVIQEIGYNQSFYIEAKSNIHQSFIDHYKGIGNNINRIFAYGISIGGLKLNLRDYSKDSYLKLVRDESSHERIMTSDLVKRIEELKRKNKNIKSMYHIGIMLSEYNKSLYGYIIAPRNQIQLLDAINFRKQLKNR